MGDINHNVTEEYRYFYPSSNNLLFDRAVTVSTTYDLQKLIKRIMALDLEESYYMNRPSSGWTFLGLPNILIKIFYIPGLVFG